MNSSTRFDDSEIVGSTNIMGSVGRPGMLRTVTSHVVYGFVKSRVRATNFKVPARSDAGPIEDPQACSIVDINGIFC
jgi:hypothetical protein